MFNQLQNESAISLDAQNIQDQFIIKNNSLKIALQDGSISQLTRSCTAIERMKDENEESYQILQIIEDIKKELHNVGYEPVKYQGRSSISLNFVVKQSETRVLFSMACLILRELNESNSKQLDSIMDSLKQMEHQNLQKIFRYIKIKQFYFVFMEECMGSFEELIPQINLKTHQNTFLKYSYELLQGLQYLIQQFPISNSCILDVKSIKISFNQAAKVSIFLASLTQIPDEEVYQIQEYIQNQQNIIFKVKQSEKQLGQNEKKGLCGQLAHLLFEMIYPFQISEIQNIQKNYVEQNRENIINKLKHISNNEQIINQIIIMERSYDDNLNKIAIDQFIAFIQKYKNNLKNCSPLLDISLNQDEKNALAQSYASYDFVGLPQKRFIPIISQELMDFQINRYFNYFQKLQIERKRNPSLMGENLTLMSLPQQKDQQQSNSKINDVSTYFQLQSPLKLQGGLQIQQIQFSISLIEEFILERFENLESNEQLEESEIKDVLDRLCNADIEQNEDYHNNKNKNFNLKPGFDNQLFKDLINRIKLQNSPITINSFLIVYLEKELELMDQFYNNQAGIIEHSFIQKKQIQGMSESHKSFILDTESQGGGNRNIANEAEFQNTNNNAINHKEIIQLLHKPFHQLLNPPTKFENINRQHLKNEILKVQPNTDFEMIVSEEQIFLILKSLHERNNITAYEIQPFQDIISSIYKCGKRMTLSTFIDQYLEACKSQREQAVNIVKQNFDLISQDQSHIKQIIGFNYFYQQMESLSRLNLMDYDNQLQKLKAPFMRIYQNISPSVKINFDKIRKKPQQQYQINQSLFGQPEIKPQQQLYVSQISNEQPIQCANAIFIGIIIFALAFIVLIMYFVWI